MKGRDPSEWERLLAAHAKRLPQTNSLVMDFKNDLAALYRERGGGKDGAPRGLERREEILEERTRVLRAVDGEQSRLMGFLAFRAYRLLRERRASGSQDGAEAGMRRNLSLTASILLEDAGCPKELKDLWEDETATMCP